MQYLKKARGPLVAECRCSVPEVNGPTSYDVHAEIRDQMGDIVAKGTVNWLLKKS